MVGTGKGTAADVEDAQRAQAEGHVAFKIKVGVADPREDAERTRKICEALDGNGDLLICADANQGWKPDQAITYVQAVADTTLAFFEQPVAWNDLEGMAQVARASRVKIGCDEGLHSLDDLRRHHDAGAAAGFSLKTIKLGGMQPGLRRGAAVRAARHEGQPRLQDGRDRHRDRGDAAPRRRACPRWTGAWAFPASISSTTSSSSRMCSRTATSTFPLGPGSESRSTRRKSGDMPARHSGCVRGNASPIEMS